MSSLAVALVWAATWEEARDEAARFTVLYRTKFRRPDYPPYRVRRRRLPHSHHDLWRVYTPTGVIPERRTP